MRKSVFGTLLLIACPLVLAQNNAHPAGRQSPSAMDKAKAEYSQNLKPGTTIDFYCLIASVDHPRAGMMISCEKPGGVYVVEWGDTFGTYVAFEKAVSVLAPKEIVHARCVVMPIQSSDQIELQCAPPVKAKQ